jgi:hypothetical protein
MSAINSIGGVANVKIMVEDTDHGEFHSNMMFELNDSGNVVVTIQTRKNSGRVYHTTAQIHPHMLAQAMAMIGARMSPPAA